MDVRSTNNKVSVKVLYKLIQRRAFTFLNTCWGFTLCVLLVYFSVYSIFAYFILVAFPSRNPSFILNPLSILPLLDEVNPCDIKSLRGYTINEEILSRCRRFNKDQSRLPTSDSISGIKSLNVILHHGPIDAVYTWVNGSDPVWLKKKELWSIKAKAQKLTTPPLNESAVESATNTSTAEIINQTNLIQLDSQNANLSNSLLPAALSANESDIDDSMSPNRYRDSNELKFSLRSLIRNAPWIRHIYIVTDNQIPSWLNLESGKLSVISHEDIFENKSHLPVFSSPAIEAHIHRIPGLSKKFIYFNDDVFLGSPVLPEDFVSSEGSQLFHMSWDVPKCAPGCVDSWLGDGFCDKACNVSSCGFDYPDCVNASSNGNSGQRSGTGGFQSNPQSPLCAPGCPEGWLADKVCDAKCKSEECGWDAGDCGLDMVVDSFPVGVLTEQNVNIFTNDVADGLDAHDRSVLDEFFGDEYIPKDSYEDNFKYHDDLYIPDINRRPYYGAVAEDFPMENSASFEEPTLTPTSQPVEEVLHVNTSAVTDHDHDNTTTAADHPSHDSAAVQPSKPPPAVILQAELGTKGVYFELTYFWCRLCSNTSCSSKGSSLQKNQTTTDNVVKFSDCRYSTAVLEEDPDSDTNPRVVHTATILSKHNVLVVVLYSEQEDKPQVPIRFPHNITFTISGSRTATTVLGDGNETVSHDLISTRFILQITEGKKKAPPMAYKDILPHGMGLIDSSSSFCVSCAAGSERGYNILPVSSNQVFSVPYASTRYPEFNSTQLPQNVSLESHRRFFPVEEAAILQLNLDRRLQNDSIHSHRLLYRHNLSQVAVRYKVTLRNGTAFSCTLPLWDVVLKFHAPKSVSSHIFSPVSNHRQTHLDEFIHSSGATDLLSFSQSDSLLSENKRLGQKQIKAIEAMMHETTLMFMAVPMPVSWTSSVSQWVHSKVEVVAVKNNASSVALPFSLSTTGHKIRWNEIKGGNWSEDMDRSRDSSYFRLACLTAVFKWGGYIPDINTSNTAMPENVTTSSSSVLPNSTFSSAHRRLKSYFAPKIGRRIANVIISMSRMIAKALSDYFILNALKRMRSPRTRRRLDLDTYGSSLVHVNRLYNKAFGNEARKVPAHLPHMIDKDIVHEMQQKWPKEWNETSQHRFRSPKDMQYSFSYYYYVYHRQKVFSIKSELMAAYLSAAVDTNHDGYLCDNEFRTLAAIVYGDAPKEDFISSLRECLSNSSESYQRRFNRTEVIHHHTSMGSIHKSFTLLLNPTVMETLNCSIVVNGLKEKIDWKAKGAPAPPVMGSDKDFVAFEMIGENYTDSLRQLDSVRARQSKFVCINDNMQHPSKELEKVLQDFYESFFPLPSIFELDPGTRNPTLYHDEYMKMRLRSQGSNNFIHMIEKNFSAVFILVGRYAECAWSGLISSFKAAVLAVAKYLIYLFDSDDIDAEYYINGIRRDITRKPSVPVSQSQSRDATSTSSDNILLRVTWLFSVIALACIIILRTLGKRNRKRSSSPNKGIASAAELQQVASPQGNSPSNRFARKKTAPKTPSKSDRKAALEAEQDDEDDNESEVSRELRGIEPVRFEIGVESDDEEEEEEEENHPDQAESKRRDNSYLGSLLGSVGLRRANSPPSTDSGDQAADNEVADDELQAKSILPSKHAAPAKSGLRKTSSKGSKKEARVHWDKSVASPGGPSSTTSNIINAIRNGPGPRAAISKMLGYS